MSYKKLTVYQTQLARRLIKYKEHTVQEAAVELSLNPVELEQYFQVHKIRDCTDQEKIYLTKIQVFARNKTRLEDFKLHLKIGMYFIYNEAPSMEHKKGLRRRGEVCYVDEFKFGVVRPNFRKEFFRYNDLMCSNVEYKLYNNLEEYENGRNPG